MANGKTSVVAPRRGAWIEIDLTTSAKPCSLHVAPRRGAWIEIIPSFFNRL